MQDLYKDEFEVTIFNFILYVPWRCSLSERIVEMLAVKFNNPNLLELIEQRVFMELQKHEINYPFIARIENTLENFCESFLLV